MNKAFKGGSVLSIIILIISLLAAGGLLFSMLQERTKRIETEQKLSDSEKAKKAVEIKLEHTQLGLIQLRDQAKLLAEQVEQEKKASQEALQKLATRDMQIAGLESNLANEKEQRSSLANILAQVREGYSSLEKELEQAKIKIEGLQGQLGQSAAKAGVKLKKIVVKPKKQLSGKVLVVNREFHFVVIDLGGRNGVSVGNEFVVYRGSQEVGKVQVEKVYSEMATAVILSGSQEVEINEGSIVKSF